MQGKNSLFHWLFKFSTSNKQGKNEATSLELKLGDPMLAYKSCITLSTPILCKASLIQVTCNPLWNYLYGVLVIETSYCIKLL
jgi:hypothetical protein